MQSQATVLKLSAQDRRRAILAASVGQFFELYDFSIYGFFAPEIGRAFFPAADPLTSLVAAFATYGVGFIMRPVGAIIVGAYGDRAGRKAALVFTIGLMGLATGLVAFLPGYNQIGIWAPIILLILRLAQGFSTGGNGAGPPPSWSNTLRSASAALSAAFIKSRHRSATSPGLFWRRCSRSFSQPKCSSSGAGELPSCSARFWLRSAITCGRA